MDTQIIVTAALIDEANRVLICQRHAQTHEGNKWEFPGGKQEPAETSKQALMRELNEEIGITVHHSCVAPLTFVETPLDTQTQLLILLYVIRTFQGVPQPKLGQAMQWVTIPRLVDYPMPVANQHFIAMLRDLL